ncbi:hypothetical protein BGX29_005843 [Mortierella sp. GBA35]|nr:hypothetical protein BGX29_005843 [Mortierella sp. GBA35]
MDPGGSSPPLGKKVRRSFEVRNTAMSAYVHGMQVSPAQLSVEESVAVREVCESGTAAATLVRFYTGRSLDSDRSTPGWNNLSIDRATFIDGKSLTLLDDLQENWDDDAVLDQIENLQAQAVEGGRRQHKFPDGAGSLPIITETDEDCQEREVDLDDWSSSEAESEFDPEETQDYIEDEDESDDTPAHYLNRNNQDDKYWTNSFVDGNLNYAKRHVLEFRSSAAWQGQETSMAKFVALRVRPHIKLILDDTTGKRHSWPELLEAAVAAAVARRIALL